MPSLDAATKEAATRLKDVKQLIDPMVKEVEEKLPEGTRAHAFLFEAADDVKDFSVLVEAVLQADDDQGFRDARAVWEEYSQRKVDTDRDLMTLLNKAMDAAREQGGAVEATFKEVVEPHLSKLGEAAAAIDKFFLSNMD